MSKPKLDLKKQGGLKMGISLRVEEAKKIDEGRHDGVITRIEQRSASKGGREFSYIDVFVRTADSAELKVGYPATLIRESALGRLLTRFGGQVIVGESVDIEAFLTGKRCSFVTVNEETDRGTFSRIQRESVKPAA